MKKWTQSLWLYDLSRLPLIQYFDIFDGIFLVLAIVQFFVLDIRGIEKTFQENAFSIAFFIIAIANILVPLAKMIILARKTDREIREMRIMRFSFDIEPPFNKEPSLSAKDIHEGYSIISSCKNGRYAYSKEFNRKIFFSDILMEPGKSKTGKIIRKNYDALKLMLHTKYHEMTSKSGSFTNEAKLNLDGFSVNGKNQLVACCSKGCYYDTFLSNISWADQLEFASGDEVNFKSPFKPFNNHNELKSLSDTDMANEIGISTLAVTQDGVLVLWTQSDKASSSEGLLTPSGSGSCDWKDSFHKTTFNATIIHAMERELLEENCLTAPPEEIFETRLLGYFRWLEKGGKPEFVGLTKIRCVYDGLKPNTNELKVKHISSPIWLGKLDIITPDMIIKKLDSILKGSQDEGDVPQEKISIPQEKISVPLHANIQMLTDMLSVPDTAAELMALLKK